ncbi:hypothetical protein [Pantoea sp.]|uniref:transcriptional antitermination N peptide n=1 Tax=Pantoea sp. TaxID=69393 RepID=UPI0028AAA59C|nr:hypothetical protein [Pantoea sp.]
MARNKMKNLARLQKFQEAKRAEVEPQMRLEKKLTVALSGCSLNVARATSAPSLREKHESTAMCLPQVALFQAGHRKVRKEAVHITK